MADRKASCLNIIQRIFSNWTALRMAVEHGMGSVDQANNFCEYIAELLFMNEQLHYTDISIELEDLMDSEFHTQLEDNSEKEVAQEIHRFYVLLNDAEKLEHEAATLPPLQPWIIPNRFVKAPQAVDSDDEIDAEGGNESMQSNSMEVDSDGFTTVRRKKK